MYVILIVIFMNENIYIYTYVCLRGKSYLEFFMFHKE